MAVRFILILLGAFLFGAAPATGQDASERATARITIPELLSFRVVEGASEAEAGAVVVTANRGWRLVLRAPGSRAVLEGGPGRDQRRPLDPVLARAHEAGELEVTLSPN